ncbi:MAG: hypothetical protein HYT79_01965 [Elusimicrobia bacterium]|nr:hypothetical protein [Elusimicrobiota bacterium]
MNRNFLYRSANINATKLIAGVLAGGIGLGTSFGLLARFSTQGSVMNFMGLKSQDVTKSFRKTLYRTANSEIIEQGASQPSAVMAVRGTPGNLTYDISFILFGKPKDWTDKASAKPDKAADAVSPIDLVKKETKPVVASNVTSTLLDMGVENTLEPLPSIGDTASGNSSKRNVESPALVGAEKRLAKATPMTEDDARQRSNARPNLEFAKGRQAVNPGINTARGAVQRRQRLIQELRGAVALGQYALGASDADSALSLSMAPVAGINISPALENLASRGEIGGIAAENVNTSAGDLLNTLGGGSGLLSTGAGPAAGGSDDSGGDTGDTGGDVLTDLGDVVFGGGGSDGGILTDPGGYQGIPPKYYDVPLGDIGGLLGGGVLGGPIIITGTDPVCPICQGTVDLDPGLIVGPAAPTGPIVQLDQTSLQSSVSLTDLQSYSAPLALNNTTTITGSKATYSGSTTLLNSGPALNQTSLNSTQLNSPSLPAAGGTSAIPGGSKGFGF